jgi:hypothetical protein
VRRCAAARRLLVSLDASMRKEVIGVSRGYCQEENTGEGIA